MKEEKRQEIKQSLSYKWVHHIAKWMDQRFLDPIIGWLLPGVGDALTSVFAVPYLYISIVKMKNIPLTLAIIYNILLDILVGLIPYLGIFMDVFKRAYTLNAQLIEGYVEGDETMMQEVDRKALWMVLLIVIVCCFIYATISLTVHVVEWVSSYLS